MWGNVGQCEACRSRRCFQNNLARDTETVLHSTLFPLAVSSSLGVLPAGVDSTDFLPFVIGRNMRDNAYWLNASPWAAGYMIRALYQMISPDRLGLGAAAPGALNWSTPRPNVTAFVAAADYAHKVLTDNGPHSWLGMMQLHNATMTMEARTPHMITSSPLSKWCQKSRFEICFAP